MVGAGVGAIVAHGKESAIIGGVIIGIPALLFGGLWIAMTFDRYGLFIGAVVGGIVGVFKGYELLQSIRL